MIAEEAGDTQEQLDHETNYKNLQVSTTYHKKVQAAKGWEKLRVEALHAVVEGFSLPPGTKCSNCQNAPAEIRCIQCGPTFTCEECTIALLVNLI